MNGMKDKVGILFSQEAMYLFTQNNPQLVTIPLLFHQLAPKDIIHRLLGNPSLTLDQKYFPVFSQEIKYQQAIELISTMQQRKLSLSTLQVQRAYPIYAWFLLEQGERLGKYPIFLKVGTRHLSVYLLELQDTFYVQQAVIQIKDLFRDAEEVCFELTFQQYMAKAPISQVNAQQKQQQFQRLKQQGMIANWLKPLQEGRPLDQKVEIFQGTFSWVKITVEVFHAALFQKLYNTPHKFHEALNQQLNQALGMPIEPTYFVGINSWNKAFTNYFTGFSHQNITKEDIVFRNALKAGLSAQYQTVINGVDQNKISLSSVETLHEPAIPGHETEEPDPITPQNSLLKYPLIGVLIIVVLGIGLFLFLKNTSNVSNPIYAQDVLGEFSGLLKIKNRKVQAIRRLRFIPQDTLSIPYVFNYRFEMGRQPQQGVVKVFPRKCELQFEDTLLKKALIYKQGSIITIEHKSKYRELNIIKKKK